jgi:hypothetical protein
VHRDSQGNVTGTTTVTRESEYDDYTRSRVFALMAYESQQCPTCKSFGTLELVEEPPIPVRWDEYDGQRIEVRKFRCLACASSAAVRRFWAEKRDGKKPTVLIADDDGLMFSATPAFPEEV